ncbi:MAG TPA: alpha/beta hydrolase [Acidimicrobiales bacterium]|nr:alpha/beta hydrolase [Acidimicrobiales bacterium]
MPTVDINGERIHFEDSGGPGAPVIFSHGFLMDHEMFAPQVEDLSGEFRCITWDERGFGLTRATKPFSYYDSAEDCLGILDHLGIDSAVLAGMSQGGFLSMRAALTAPERVKALVLIDTQAGVEDPATLQGYNAMQDEWISNGPANVQDAIAGIILGGGVDPKPWFEKWAALPRDGFQLAYECLVGRDDITDRLSEITRPAMIVHGDEDQAIPMEKAKAMHDGLANSEGLVVVKGAAHAGNLSHPDQVNPPLREFLRKHA